MRTVISQIDFDETPGSAAIVRLQGELNNLQTGSGTSAANIKSQWEHAGAAFEHRMFSMREAARALLGGITVGGLVLALKNLAEQVIRSSDRFKDLEVSAGNVEREFFALARNVFNVNEGVSETVTWMDRLAGVMRALQEVQEAHPAAAKASQGFISQVLFGLLDPAGIVADIQSVGKAVDVYLSKQVEAAKATPAQRLPEGDFLSAAGIILRKTPEFAERARRAMGDFTDTVREAVEVTDSLFVGMETGWADKGKVTVKDMTQEFRNFEENAIRPARNVEIAVTAAAEAFQFLGQALAQAIAQGGKGRDLFRGVLIGLSATMFAKAAEYVAYALAASTGVGAATLGGTPHQFLIAAAKFAAVGTIAAVAARASGGPSQGGVGGASARGASGVSNAPVRPSQSISFVFEGNVGSEEFFRKAVLQIQDALADGAGGGTF